MKYYNEIRTHLSLEKDALVPRAIEVVGHILSVLSWGAATPICSDLIYDRHNITNTSGYDVRHLILPITELPCAYPSPTIEEIKERRS